MRAVLKISAGFLAFSLALLAGVLYGSDRYLDAQQRMAAAGDVPGAISASEEAARFNPFSPQPLIAEASLLQSRGKNQEAEDVLRVAIQRDPKNYLTYYSLGNVQMTVGDFKDAVANYRKSEHLNPKATAVTTGLAQALVRQGDLKGAKKEYEKLQREKAISVSGLYDLGRIYVRTGQPKKGYKTINQARRRAAAELPKLQQQDREQQKKLLESMTLASADALVVEGQYEKAYRIVARSPSSQAPALLRLISTDPGGYRKSVLESEIY